MPLDDLRRDPRWVEPGDNRRLMGEHVVEAEGRDDGEQGRPDGDQRWRPQARLVPRNSRSTPIRPPEARPGQPRQVPSS